MGPTHDYRACFPFAEIRDDQKTAIEFALDTFLAQKKRFLLLELGTGVGKSAVGLTLARYLAEHGGKTFAPAVPNAEADEIEPVETTGAYVLTTQKILQQQYIDDFGPASGKNLLRSLNSASNYQCRFYSDQSCAASRRLLKQLGKQLEGTDFHKCCRSSCPYMLDKAEFISYPIGITNFAYFLAETAYAKQLEPRSLLVIDEAHNVESALGSFVEVIFSERFAKTVLNCRVPKLDTDASVIEWIKDTYKKALLKTMRGLEKKVGDHFHTGGAAGSALADMSKRYEMLDKHLCKVNRFIDTYDATNWVMNPIKTPPGESRGGRKFEFKPVDVSSFGHEHLYRFGSRVVLMSATLLDKDTYCKSIGIDPNEAAYLRLPSPFPKENRPVHFLGVGSMSMKTIDDTLPKLASTVKDLLALHANDKGMIHSVSFKVARYLVDTIKSPRLLLHDSTNREETIQKHLDSSEPTVLISPSMTEGVDLADDASRFQILCKVPFPYLGDRVIQLRKQRNSSWYSMMTARAIIQALGRSVRNSSDYATSYILDSDWQRFYRLNASMFPAEFAATLMP